MNRFVKTSAIAVPALLASLASADVIKIADSIDEFSNAQGQNGWTYGWYLGSEVALSGGAGTLDTSNFQQFGHYEDGIGWWTHDPDSAASGAGSVPFFLTVITADAMHANAPIAGTTVNPEVRWASRRWASEASGQIQIAGSISKIDQGPLLGDGVDAYITVDGEVVHYYEVAADDFDGTTFDLTLDVDAGSLVEFIVGGKGNGLNDAVTFEADIIGTSVPAPGAVALIGLGGLLTTRRRR